MNRGRGTEELKRFSDVMSGPVMGRYVSVPLAMMSASGDREVALRFALNETARGVDQHPVLWEIRVVGLNPELIGRYRERYPASVVTSLCAMPVSQLSNYPRESEILLRGPHFQLTSINTDSVRGRPVLKVRALMPNTNRDHITAIASNVGSDRSERELFRTLILLDRFTRCAALATEEGRLAEAEQYLALGALQRRALEEMEVG